MPYRYPKELTGPANNETCGISCFSGFRDHVEMNMIDNLLSALTPGLKLKMSNIPDERDVHCSKPVSL